MTVEELITTAYQATAASEQSSDDLDKEREVAILYSYGVKFGQLRSVARVLERWRAAGFFPIFYHLKDQARRDVQNYRQRGLKASLIKTPKVIVASGRHNGRWAGLFERSGR